MKRILVTKQQKMKQFLRTKGIEFEIVIDLNKESLDDIQEADVYSEDLPIEIASQAKTYTHINLEVPFEKRRKHLTLEELEQYFKGLNTYTIQFLGGVKF